MTISYKEHYQKYGKKYGKTEEYKKYKKEYNNLPKTREYLKKYLRENTQKKRKEVIEKLGGRCIQCNFSDIRALQVDHVNGGGNKERKKLSGGPTFYNKVLESIKNNLKEYQLLCANCNWIKRYTNDKIKR